MTVRTRALVTGSAGFIGSHLITRLLELGIHVRALVRRGITARHDPECGNDIGSGSARFERVRGDVLDSHALKRASEGCDVVFHCAAGGTSLQEARRINVEGTRNVIEAASRAGIRRVVHLSSMAVHGRRLPPLLTEEFPLVSRGDAYALSKAEGEKTAFETGAALNVQVVVLRPTLVYGPRAAYWLMFYFERTKNEQVALIDRGKGLANLVWIDDLVDAMFAAWKVPDAAGEAFLISGAHPVTWREYIARFAQMCGKPTPPSLPGWRAMCELQWLRVYGALTQRPRRLFGMDLILMRQHTAVSIEKAQRVLGYAPAFSFEDGMRQCEVWLRRQGLLSADSAQASRNGHQERASGPF